MALTITSDGIEVPNEYQNKNKMVVRTPTGTINISSGFSGMVRDGRFPLVSKSEYESIPEDCENPSLTPNKIRFKPHGETAEEFEVVTE